MREGETERERGLSGGLGEREAQEVEERIKARGWWWWWEGGCYGKECLGVARERGWEGLAGVGKQLHTVSVQM